MKRKADDDGARLVIPERPIVPALYRGRDGFQNFLGTSWEQVHAISKGLPPDRIQLDMAHFLQHGPQNKCLLAYRGAGKSYLTIAYCGWRAMLDPSITILIVSQAYDYAKELADWFKTLIAEMPLLAHLSPKNEDGVKDLDRVEKFNFHGFKAKQPSVKSLGVMGMLNGNHCDIVIADDIEVPSNSETPYMRTKLRKRVSEFQKIANPGGKSEIIYLGTPQIPVDSLYDRLPKAGVRVRRWPARYPREDMMPTFKETMSPMLVADIEKDKSIYWQATEPTRHGEDFLRLQENDVEGWSGFMLQFMLDTSPSGESRYPLRLRDLVVTQLAAEVGPLCSPATWTNEKEMALTDLPAVGLGEDGYFGPSKDGLGPLTPYQKVIMGIDPAGFGSRADADEVGWAIVGGINGFLYLLDIGGLQGGFSEPNCRVLATKIFDWKVHSCVIESNFGAGAPMRLLQRHVENESIAREQAYGSKWNCGFSDVFRRRTKEHQILDTLEGIVQQHKLIVNRRCIQDDFDKTNPLVGPDAATEFRAFYQFSHIYRIDTKKETGEHVQRRALKHDDRIDALTTAAESFIDSLLVDHREATRQMKERELRSQLKDIEDFTMQRGAYSSHTPRPSKRGWNSWVKALN